jgi:hypothetical protein
MVYSTDPNSFEERCRKMREKGFEPFYKDHQLLWRPIRRGLDLQRHVPRSHPTQKPSKETRRGEFKPLSLHSGFTNEDLKNEEIVRDDQTLGKMLLDTEAIEDIKETVHDILRIVRQIRLENTRKELRR